MLLSGKKVTEFLLVPIDGSILGACMVLVVKSINTNLKKTPHLTIISNYDRQVDLLYNLRDLSTYLCDRFIPLPNPCFTGAGKGSF